MINKSPVTILEAIRRYLSSVELSRSINTARTYANGMRSFLATLIKNGIDPDNDPTSTLNESLMADFAADLKPYSPNTEQLYLSAVTGFYEFVAAEKLADINLPRLRMLIKRRARRPGQRLPQFPKNDIKDVLNYAQLLSALCI